MVGGAGNDDITRMEYLTVMDDEEERARRMRRFPSSMPVMLTNLGEETDGTVATSACDARDHTKHAGQLLHLKVEKLRNFTKMNASCMGFVNSSGELNVPVKTAALEI